MSLPARCAVVAALALALGLAGCGRKGSLDPPPASVADPAAAGAPAPGPDGQVAASGPPGTQPAPKKRLPIDWLLD
jgi:predicted small lipoprotein YifL